MRVTNPGRRDLLALGALIAAWVWIGQLANTRTEPLAFLAGYAVASVAYAWLAWRIVARRLRLSLVAIACVALVIRALVLGSAPTDDMARYVWEGRVVAAGHSPYILAPTDEALETLAARSPEHAAINHPEWTAIYPPLTMLVHTALATLAPRALAFKLAFVAVEAVIFALVVALLRRRALPEQRVALFALNPLTVWAVALEGHHEPLGAVWIVAMLVAFDGARGARGARVGAAWALACLSKGFALVVAPTLVGRLGWRGWLMAAVTAALVTLPFASSGPGLVDSLSRFGSELSVNDTLHALAQELAPTPSLARLALATIGLGVAAWLLARRRRVEHQDATFEAAVLLGTLILLLPTVHPWYLYSLVPLLCIWPWPGWIALTLTISLTWLPHVVIRHTGEWVEWRDVIPIEYGPLFAWLVIVAWRGVRKFRME